MKIKFDTDDQLPLSKTTKIPSKAIVFRAVFHENNKYYPQFFQINVCMKHKQKIKNFKTFVLKITTAIRYFHKNVLINQLKNNHKFLFIV